MSKEAMKLALEYLEQRELAWNVQIALREALAEPEFFTHNVKQPYDWSEWVCPDPKSYLMKCCDCGLVHEAEFGVVRYKSETEREDCERVDDPNLQAVFRMRRSEQWSPADTAHRAGGLPMEQPAQQQNPFGDDAERYARKLREEREAYKAIFTASTPQPAQQEPVAWLEILRNNKTATDEVIGAFLRGHAEHLTSEKFVLYTPAAPQPAQQQEPVARLVWRDGVGFMLHLLNEGRKLPEGDYDLYTSPPAQRAFVGLTDEEAQWLYDNCRTPSNLIDMTEAKLKERNT